VGDRLLGESRALHQCVVDRRSHSCAPGYSYATAIRVIFRQST
jgi:hypothetical protein